MPIDTENLDALSGRECTMPFGEDLVKKTGTKEELLKVFDSLEDDQKQKAIDFIKNLALASMASGERPWMELVGILDSKSAEQMRSAIEEDCENINESAW